MTKSFSQVIPKLITKLLLVVEKEWPRTLFKSLEVNFFVISIYPFFTYFWHLKITNQEFKKFPRLLCFPRLTLSRSYFILLTLNSSYFFYWLWTVCIYFIDFEHHVYFTDFKHVMFILLTLNRLCLFYWLWTGHVYFTDFEQVIF